MKICFICPALPPKIDGIGDYTAHLASELAQLGPAKVTVLTAMGFQGAEPCPDSIEGVSVVPLFTTSRCGSIRGIVSYVRRHRPDWLVLQYNPFSFGRWGLNPYLPGVLRSVALKRDPVDTKPSTQIALMCHEAFVPVINWKFAIMASWQRWQFREIAKASDFVCFSMQQGVTDFRGWFPDKPLLHLPVGSNVPAEGAKAEAREATRSRLGVSPDTTVLGVFGSAHSSRMFDWIYDAARFLLDSGRRVLVLYVGSGGDAARAALDGVPHFAVGPLPPKEVSQHLCASDVYLAPFVDGVSARRGSFIAALEHGLASVTTIGKNTDSYLRSANGSAFIAADVNDRIGFVRHVQWLANDVELRRRLGGGARELYEARFSWKVIASQFLDALTSATLTPLILGK